MCLRTQMCVYVNWGLSMARKNVCNATILEEKHMISILIFLANHGPSRKIDIYDGVSSNPRMPDKLNVLEEMGLLVQELDQVTRSTIVELTPGGEQAAKLLISVDRCIRSINNARGS